MRRVLFILALASVPLLLMLQVFQGYRYAIAVEDAEGLKIMQQDSLEKNKKTLAGIAVYSAPERIYQVAGESLGLAAADEAKVLQVRFSGETEVLQ
jgi:hypothetical protein